MQMVTGLTLWAALIVGNVCALGAERELPLLLKEDFEHGMGRWQTTDPDPARSVWEIVPGGEAGNHVLRVTGPSQYEPPYRSPLSIAWLKDVVAADFVLTARVQNTNSGAGPHRDLCFFWGRQDASHFYYVHLGARPDPHACQIFIVNGAPRTMITAQGAEGTPWTDGWHDVKVVRRTGDGAMEVYFDDMSKPLMTARDTTFTSGQVGIGTFDDHGNFDDVMLWGEERAARSEAAHGSAVGSGSPRLCRGIRRAPCCGRSPDRATRTTAGLRLFVRGQETRAQQADSHSLLTESPPT